MFRAGGMKRKAAMKMANFQMPIKRKVLTAKARNNMPASTFAGPNRSYPINDANHARNALSRVSQFGSPALQAKVRAAVGRKYPGIGKKKTAKKQKAPMPEKQNLGLALKRAKRKQGIRPDMAQGTKLEHREEGKREFKRSKKRKASHDGKMVDPKTQGGKMQAEEFGKKEFKHAKKHKSSGGKRRLSAASFTAKPNSAGMHTAAYSFDGDNTFGSTDPLVANSTPQAKLRKRKAKKKASQR